MKTVSKPISILAGATILGLLLGSSSAWAQSQPGGNPGQFGGGAPGQFDPNAQPGAPQPGASPAPGGATPAPSPFGGMNAGGLSPPPPSNPLANPQPTDPGDPTQSLDDAKEEDSGRGVTWFWLEAGGGFEHIALEAIDATNQSNACSGNGASECGVALDRIELLTPTTGTGPMIDGGLGLRLIFFTLGARGRLGFFEDFSLARVGGEVGLRIPLGSLEPRFQAGAGYAAQIADVAPATGFYARVGGGLDYFVLGNLALGGDVSGEIVGLSRDTPKKGGQLVTDFVSASVGLGVGVGLHVGLHL